MGKIAINPLILDASATLAFLNGLKSSLTCTGAPFLITRVPKNGLGVAGGAGFCSYIKSEM